MSIYCLYIPLTTNSISPKPKIKRSLKTLKNSISFYSSSLSQLSVNYFTRAEPISKEQERNQ